jgi:lipopolysaccharide transport system permease protein
MLREIFSDVYAGRELAWRLSVRDISAQYRQTALGILWAFFLPIANTATWLFLKHTGIVSVSDTSISYPVYVFTGTMLWSIFTEAVSAPLKQTTAAKPMLAKLNFPREALLVSALLQTLFNAAIKVAVLLVALPLMGVELGPTLVLFPIGLLSLVLIGMAFGLLLTPVGLLYSDVAKGLPVLTQFLMYLTPVVFAFPKEGIAATLHALNPVAPSLMAARDWLTGQAPEHLLGFFLVNVFAFFLLAVMLVVYRVAMPIMIERMSA